MGLFSSPKRPIESVLHPVSCKCASGAFLTEVNRPGRETDHSLISSVEVKNDFTTVFTVVRHCPSSQQGDVSTLLQPIS
jgi:hypothetical protein